MSKLNGNRAQAERDGRTVHVAILGAGRIAHSMARTLVAMAADERYAALVEPYAVAARDEDRAAAFAKQYGFPMSYGSYEQMLADPDVDLVYIATPHALHAEQGIACIRAGKNILVEKSFTANAAQAVELLDVAEASGLLCTEAIWTRYMPSRAIINDLVASGEIGEIRAINADLGYPVSHKARMTDPAMAGGALLDVGVYPLNFIDMVMKGATPKRMATACTLHESGVDEQSSTTLFYPNGVMAVASSSMTAATDRLGAIWGTRGYLLCENINNVQSVGVYNTDHELQQRIDVPPQLTGYEYQVASSANAILDGHTECAEMPHADTVRIMKLMDAIRADWEVTFPFER